MDNKWQIKTLIENRAAAVRRKDIDAMIALFLHFGDTHPASLDTVFILT